MRFSGKVIIVTGANSGLGRAAALNFAREGATILAAARRREEGEALIHEISGLGGKGLFVPTDVTNANDVENLVKITLKNFGRLDAAFNNAGVAEEPSPIDSLEESAWNRVIDVNLKGVWLCMKYQIPALIQSGGGSIVNMSSVYGITGTGFGLSAYVASKHGVIGLTKAAALEYAHSNIRVNAICPGWIPTPGNEAALSNPDVLKLANKLHPMGRLGTDLEIAKTVAWLCSHDSGFVTGQAICVDGGYTSQ